jgi:PEP-CTERM motif
MKFQLKAITAAVILAASIPAQAAMTTAGSGNGSFVLTVFDKVANVQASFDLGQSYSDFNQVAAAGAVTNVTALGTSLSWNLASNADYSSAWSSFIGAATLPNIQYAISSGDNTGAPGVGSRGYITTLKTPGATITNTAMIQAMGPLDTFINNENFFGHTAANGSLFTPSATTGGVLYNFNRLGGSSAGPLTVGSIGETLGVVQLSYGGSSNFSNSVTTVFGNGAGFTLAANGLLTYATNPAAPIPEADTWAMMLLGLGFMGFVARRRQA